MKNKFEIKITFEQDGQKQAVILFSAKPGKIGSLFNIDLIRYDKTRLAAKIAKTLFRILSQKTKAAVQASGQCGEARA